MERRYGSFEIPRELMEECPQLVQEIMSQCIPLKVEFMFHTNSFEYIAFSDWFDLLGGGEKHKCYALDIVHGSEEIDNGFRHFIKAINMVKGE
jgi:hypothetical protein